MIPAALAARFAGLPPPLVVYNKSHSGSRLLADLLRRGGVFMGAAVNETNDSLPLLDIVRAVVLGHYPRFERLFAEGDAALAALTEEAFARHLAGHDGVSRWGWKLGETVYALPYFAALFPRLRAVHLIRDGRDVALSDHVAPNDAFWRKVYFDSDAVRWWRRRPLTHRSYRHNSAIYNARHWVSSVSVGRNFGSMLGERYRELRYEALVHEPRRVLTELFDWAELPLPAALLDHAEAVMRQDRVGKFASLSKGRQRQVLEVLEPTLTAFGYGDSAGWVPGRFRRTPG